MNKIKKYIVDLLLAPITLLYQKVLDLEATSLFDLNRT